MTAFYSPAARPEDEEKRQHAVDVSGFLQAGGDAALAAIVQEAAGLLGAPMAAISIVDHDRQYFPAEVGIGASETPRAASFCAHALLDCDNPLCVPDAAADRRFAGNPLVLSGPEIRFYAGVPLVAEDGQPLGALCVLGREAAAPPTDAQLVALTDLADRAIRRAAELKG
jgi:GAF domain-containing protein